MNKLTLTPNDDIYYKFNSYSEMNYGRLTVNQQLLSFTYDIKTFSFEKPENKVSLYFADSEKMFDFQMKYL